MKRKATLAAIAAIALLTSAAHAEEPAKKVAEPAAPAPAVASIDGLAPEVRYPPTSTRYKLIAVGAVLAGGAWGVAYGAGQGWQTVPGAAQLKIPVAGPWIALGKTGCASDDPQCATGTLVVRTILLTLDAVVQLGGLAIIAEAIAMKTEAPAAEKKASFLGLRYRGVEVMPAPVVSPGGAGFGIVGTF
jgi:hypothetical protein